MDKLDKSIIERISAQNKFDSGFVGVLSTKEETEAIVRVRNPFHLGLLERSFRVTHSYPFIRSVGINCGLREAIKLERMQEVEYVSAQGRVTALTDTRSSVFVNAQKGMSAPTSANSDSTDKVFAKSGNASDNAPQSLKTPVAPIKGGAHTLSAELDGSGVTLCVMDTGINVHTDLSVPRERIVKFIDYVGGSAQPYDDNGHGTMVSGIACGNGLLSAGEIIGVAPKANLVGLKVIGADGESGTFRILDGMQWLFDNFRQYGIRVVCMSFGAEPLSYADPLKIGAEMLVRSGLTVVAAAGNSGEGGVKSPAISSEVIAVGAVDGNYVTAPFSSYGEYQGILRPDVYAAGVGVKGIAAGSTYSNMTGTSAAAPYVAGACCLLCQKYKNITPRQIKNSILNASIDFNGQKILNLR